MGIAGFFGVLAVAVFFLVSFFFGSDDKTSEDKRQLDGLDDGIGGVFVNGEHMTRQEAEDAQSRGEFYDTYY
ncbi:hypothetical protein NQT65_19105 [Pseudoalteromonas agarivorans]|uniref:hypothetical protein n=1 Tax=Pseudoalteromonas agarivorans TaxID=176102 RepID=UPI0021193A84|nr:hypothetical protein [Pseudoalteromonas agarivorans]MCQ8822303.1 hypothetical protein [Pseudoalteromonas agarivorans]